MILSGTGHRCEKLPDQATGYDLSNPTYQYIRKELTRILQEMKPEQVISGMALGYDQLLAEVSIDLNIPFLAAVPFTGQEAIWPKASQARYHELLSKAAQVVIVSTGGYSARKLNLRNEWMCDHSDHLVACYNGDLSGGTFNCIQYAKKIGLPITYIDPRLATA